MQKLQPYHIPILIFVAVFVYSHTLFHEFVYDDKIVLVENENVKNGLAGIKQIWVSNYLNGYQGFNDALYRPLSLTVFNWTYSLFGSEPLPYHLINILLYGLLIGVLYKLFDNIFPGARHYLFFGVLIFAVHPIHTEVVANVKSLDEILALLFGTIACLFAIKNRGRWQDLLILFCCYLLALFSKESAISFSIIIPVVHFFSSKEFDRKRLVLLSLGLLTLTGLWYFWHQHIVESMIREVDSGLFGDISNSIVGIENPFTRFATGLWLFVKYFFKLIFPWPLYGDYSFGTISEVKFMSIRFLSTLLFFGVSIWLLFRGFQKRNDTALAVILFFVSITPIANVFLYIGTTFAERLVFTSSICVIPLVISLRGLNINKLKYLFIGLVSVFSVVTVNRAWEWRTNLSLFEADSRRNVKSFRTQYNYATTLSETVSLEAQNEDERARLNKAITVFNNALAIRPDFADAILNLGNAHKRLGQFDEALALYDKLITADPDYSRVYYNKGIILYQLKRYQEARESLLLYTEKGMGSLAPAWYWAGVSSGYLNDFSFAIEYLNNSLKLDVSKWEAWNFLGMAYGNVNQWKEAKEAFDRAFSINPTSEIEVNLNRAKDALNGSSIK